MKRSSSPINQTQENPVCDTIRRNIRDDSGLVQSHEQRIGQLRTMINQRQEAIRALERQREELRQIDAQLPQLPGPQIPIQARGRLRALLEILKRLGQVIDILTLSNAFRRAQAISRAESEIDQRIKTIEEEIADFRGEANDERQQLKEHAAWIKHHFEQFDAYGCHGNAFNSYQFTPSAPIRRLLR